MKPINRKDWFYWKKKKSGFEWTRAVQTCCSRVNYISTGFSKVFTSLKVISCVSCYSPFCFLSLKALNSECVPFHSTLCCVTRVFCVFVHSFVWLICWSIWFFETRNTSSIKKGATPCYSVVKYALIIDECKKS